MSLEFVLHLELEFGGEVRLPSALGGILDDLETPLVDATCWQEGQVRRGRRYDAQWCRRRERRVTKRRSCARWSW